MPPSVQYACVAGSGPNVRPCRSAARRRSSSTAPGSTRASRRAGSTSRTRRTWREKSSTTATLQHWPAREVPAPRVRTGAPNRRQTATAATTSSADSGNDDADRDLPVVRRVGRVERAASGVEADRAAHLAGESSREAGAAASRVGGSRAGRSDASGGPIEAFRRCRGVRTLRRREPPASPEDSVRLSSSWTQLGRDGIRRGSRHGCVTRHEIGPFVTNTRSRRRMAVVLLSQIARKRNGSRLAREELMARRNRFGLGCHCSSSALAAAGLLADGSHVGTLAGRVSRTSRAARFRA